MRLTDEQLDLLATKYANGLTLTLPLDFGKCAETELSVCDLLDTIDGLRADIRAAEAAAYQRAADIAQYVEGSSTAVAPNLYIYRSELSSRIRALASPESISALASRDAKIAEMASELEQITAYCFVVGVNNMSRKTIEIVVELDQNWRQKIAELEGKLAERDKQLAALVDAAAHTGVMFIAKDGTEHCWPLEEHRGARVLPQVGTNG